MNTDAVLDRLIAGNDLDELVREVDRRTDARDWEGLLRLRDRCRLALERGFQLWPAASLAEYRLALRAPAPFAATVITEGGGRFSVGPLTEVAASSHTWEQLAALLPASPLAGAIAHERVVRGEDLREVAVPYADLFELPLALKSWEPHWPLPHYHDDRVEEPRPPLPKLTETITVDPPAAERLAHDPDAENALNSVTAHWVAHSNGRSRAVTVEGDGPDAISYLVAADPRHERDGVRAALVPASDVLVHVAWAGASGGAHGRRRGAAAGRDAAWEVVDATGGIDGLDDRQWWLWSAGIAGVGWQLRLAVHDPRAGLAWALEAVDTATS